LKLTTTICTSLLLIFFFSAVSNAQVTGFVVDHQNNRPVFGATVSTDIPGIGTQTDQNGYFSLNIDDFPVTLSISYIGYKTVQVEVENDTEKLEIILEPEIVEGEHITISADRVQISEHESRPVPVVLIKPSDMLMTIRDSAPEMLRSEPGVYIQQTTIGQGSVYVRGRSGRDVLYLFNNFRMNPGFTRSGQNQYFAAIDVFSLDEIRVYRGPVSVFYGSDALSGGVHVKPYTPSFSDTTLTTGNLQLQTNFRGTGERTVTSGFRHHQNRFALSVQGTWRDFRYYSMPNSSDDDRWFPYNNRLDLADMNFGAINATGRFRVNDTFQLSIASYYSKIPDSPRLDRMILGYDIENEPVPTQPRNGYFSNTAPLEFNAQSVTLNFSNISPVISSMRFRLGFHRLNDDRKEKDFASPPYFSTNSTDKNDSFTISEQTIYDQNQSNQWLFSTDFISPVSDRITLSWGSDFGYEYIKSRTLQDGAVYGLPRYPNGSEIISGGAFLHADYHAGPKLLLESGLRYSVIQNRIPFEGQNTIRGFDPIADTYKQLTGAIGARYSLSRSFDVTSNISTGFRAPNVADLAEIGVRRSDQFQSPNIDLIPEKSMNIDAGLHYNSEILSFEGHLFWLHYFDKIERVLTGNIIDRDGRFIREGESVESASEFIEVISDNMGYMNLIGVEIGTKLTLQNNLTAGFTFTYNWGEIKSPDGGMEPVDRIPPANGLAYLSFERIRHLTLRPQIRYNMSHRRISPLEVGDNRISKYGTDGFVNVQFITVFDGIPSLQMKIFADNLLDTSYREHASSLDGLTRNVTVSVSYSF